LFEGEHKVRPYIVADKMIKVSFIIEIFSGASNGDKESILFLNQDYTEEDE
jgi:hypothetical protein